MSELALPDPGHEVMARIEKARVGAYSSREVAQRVVAELREQAPQILAKWLSEAAEDLAWELVNRMDRAQRGQARRASARSVFAGAVGPTTPRQAGPRSRSRRSAANG